MHEFSIAEAVIDIAQRHANGRRVHRIELKVGHLRQVVPSALQYAFELLSDGTPVEGAELVIEDVSARGWCRSCGAHTTMTAFPMQCEGCGGMDLELEAGEELLVDALELDDELEMTTGGVAHGG
jgi:hydrogenase nickel incorporation protein HypA/HybF